MIAFAFLLVLLPITFAQNPQHKTREYEKSDYYVVHLDPSASPYDLATHLGLTYDGEWAALEDHHVFMAAKHDHDIIERALLPRKQKREPVAPILDNVLFAQKQVRKQRLFKRGVLPHRKADENSGLVEADAITEREQLMKTLDIQDPIFTDQWHLFNVQQVSNDMNVSKVWLEGVTGRNVTVCIIDDGLDMDSEDIKPNYNAEGSWDYNNPGPDPKPRLFDDHHGTRCGGEVAAAKNNVCGVGVAYDAGISGVRILSAGISDADEAEAVQYRKDINHIYSCSWGPPDDGRTMDAPGILIKKAMQTAIQKGRNGLGSIYVFAVGNGANSGDNCNFDGYTNSIFSVSIGAVDKTNSHPYYSEACSAQLAVTYSSGAGDSIHTTDVGANKCTTQHGGTSAAGPLVSGIYALVLSVRPELTWRDIQWLTVYASQPFYKEEPEKDWQITATGNKFSHQYGYGIVDAYEIVKLARTWTPVKKQAWLHDSPWIHVRHDLPEGNTGLTSKFTVTEDMLRKSNLERIEHVTVTLFLNHERRGDVSVELHSPLGVVSYLAPQRRYDESTEGFEGWTFMSVAHFGESGIGDWTLLVKDSLENGKVGTWGEWKLMLYGEAIDSAKQELLPMPQKNDNDDHDKDVAEATTTGKVATTSLTSAPSATFSPITSSLPIRPTIAKPAGTNDNSKPTESPPPAAPSDSGFLPSSFPTFGLSRATQVWVYGAIVIIALFVLGLATYWFLQRRKRTKTDPYVFEMLDERETDAMLETTGPKSRRRRAGELYDAFAGESDEDDLLSDDDSIDGQERFRDRGSLEEEQHHP